MNRVFRIIWSHVLNAWVANSETTLGRGKRNTTRKIIATALALSLAPLAHAAPIGGQVVSGGGSIDQSGDTTNIQQTTQNLSLNWQTFNVASSETVNYLQPSASAIAVNRIFDTNGSQILGRLNANGQVWLINPNGVLFGQGAQVNVGGLVATTLDFNDAQLGSGSVNFSGNGSGSVINQGSINAANGGYVALLGNHVGNQGSIVAQLGSVALGAGSAATLTFNGSGLAHMQVEQSTLDNLAENGGLIRANGGQIVMTAGAQNALLASVVNNSGILEARAVENRNGTIILTGGMSAGTANIGGTVDVSSATGNGGQIIATAHDVTVADNATLDASGATGGGSVNIGGGWQGSGDIAQATSVTMAAGANINASATQQGDGGTVVLWSDVSNTGSSTAAQGSLKARGAGSGNGGNIETSGYAVNIAGAQIDAGAESGSGGAWLLDPFNYTIDATAAGTISSTLDTGTDVTIDTANNTGPGAGASSNGDITVTSAISKAAGGNATLTLKAARHIALQSGANFSSSSNQLNLQFWADSDNSGDGINQVANSTFNTNGGWLKFGNNQTATINGQSVLVGGDVYFNGGSAQTISTGGGAVDIYGETIIGNSNGLSISTSGGDVGLHGVLNSGNTYTWVDKTADTAHDWTWARTDAINGTGGGAAVGDSYLVTITSRLENAIAGLTAGYNGAWIGAYRANPGSSYAWTWADGPEGGEQFFTQNNPNGGTTTSGYYSNFGSGEPNGSLSPTGENVGQFFGTAGQWNDLVSTTQFSATQASGYAVLGYVRETNAATSPLSINAGSGTVTINNAVGSSKALASLDITAGLTTMNGGAVETEGTQTYNAPVELGVDTTLTTLNSDITFGSTVNSVDPLNPRNLTVNILADPTYYWVNWTSSDATHVYGTITIGSDTINVTYSNDNGYAFMQTDSAITKYNAGSETFVDYWATDYLGTHAYDGVTYISPYVSSNIANGPSTADLIAVRYAGSQTLTFSQSVENLAYSVMSINGNGYGFNQDFTIESYSGLNGATTGYYGGGTLTKNINGSVYEMNDGGVNSSSQGGFSEPHGTIRFNNAFSELTWTNSAEYWNGFTVGVSGTSASVGSVNFNGIAGGTAALGTVSVNGAMLTTANISDAASLTVSGNTSLGGDITTSGNQTFNSAVTLTSDASLTTTANGSVETISTIDGAHAMTINTNGTGDTTFNGAVGGNSALTGLSITTDVVNAGALTLAASSMLDITNGGASEISGVISGSGATLTKAGAGTLTLSGANTYTGGSTLSEGVLKLGVATSGSITNGPLGTGMVTVATGGALDLAGYDLRNALDLAGTGVSDSGALYNSAATAVEVPGDTTLSADASIKSESGGDLTLSGTIDGAHGLTIDTNGGSSDAAIDLRGIVGGSTALTALSVDSDSADTTLSAAATVNGLISVYGGAVTLNADLTTTDTTTGDIVITTSSLSGSGNIALASGRNLTVTQSGNSIYDGAISGTNASFTKAGAGDLGLGGASSYTGATTVDGGVLSLAAAERLSDITALTVNANGTFSLNGFDETVGSIAGSGLIVNGAVVRDGLVLWLDAGNAASYDGSGTTWYDLSGNGYNATLYGSPTYNAGTSLFSFTTNDQYAQITALPADFLGSTVSGVTVFTVANFGDTNNWERVVDLGNTGVGGNAPDNNIILSRYGADASRLNFEIYTDTNQANPHQTDVNTAIANNVKSSFAGTADGTNFQVFKDGVLNTTTAQATLPNAVVRNDNYIGKSNWTQDDTFRGDIGTVMVYNRALSAAEITKNHQLLFNRSTATLTAGGDNTSTTFSGKIENGVSTLNLVKAGSGTLTLTGENNYSGSTTVQAGTLDVSGSGHLGTAGNYAGVIANAGVFRHSSTADQTLSGVISGSGELIQEGNGDLTLSGANTYTGATSINAGVLKLGTAGSGANSPLGTTAGATTVADGAALDLAGYTLATAEAITISGTGVSSSGAVYNSSSTGVTWSGATTLSGDASIKSESGGALTWNGTIDGAYAMTVDTNGSSSDAAFTLGNVLGGSTQLTGLDINSGTANTTLSAAATVNGPMTVVGGTINVNADLASTASGADVLTRASGDIVQATGTTISTNGGSVIDWADSDGSGSGYIQLNGSVTTQGGHLWLGGGNGTTTWNGLTVGNGYARGNTTITDGVNIASTSSIDTAGGDVSISGQALDTTGNYTSNGVALYGAINAGAGAVTLDGLVDTGYVGASNSNFGRGVRLDGMITTTSGNVSVTGTVNGVNGVTNAQEDGILIVSNGGVTTTSGNITLTGSCNECAGSTTAGAGISWNSTGNKLVSQTGDITIRATGSKTAGTLTDFKPYSAGDLLIGYDGSNAYSGNIRLVADEVTLTGAILQSTGSLSIEPYTASTTIGIGGGAGTLQLSAANFSTNFVDGFARITVGRSDGSGKITTGALTVNDDLTLLNTSGGQEVTGALNAGSNTLVLNTTGTLAETGSGAITAGSLALLNAASATLDGTSNSVGTLAAAGVGNLSYIDSDALAIGSVGASDGISATGTITVGTLSGDLTVSQDITTSDTTSSALTLNAGVNTAAGTASGGNIVLSGSPSVAVGSGGTAKLYTGSLSGSTGLTTLVGSGSGRFRYNSDESASNFTTALATGLNAIYREQPTISSLAVGDRSITYGDATPTWTFTLTGSQNGDTLAQAFSGAGPTVTVGGITSTSGNYIVGDHTLTASGSLGTSQLGYASTAGSYTDGTLTVAQKALTVSYTGVNKAYDGTTSTTVTTGDDRVTNDVLTITRTAAFEDENAANGVVVNVTGASISGTDSANYSLASSTGSTTANISKKTVTLSAEKVYDGLTALGAGTVTISTGIGSETLSYSGATANDIHVTTIGKYIDAITLADATDASGGLASNYALPTLNAANAPVTIAAKALTSTASIGGTLSKTYDGTTAATAATLSGSVSGAIAGDTLSLDTSGLALTYDSIHVATASQISASGSADFAIDSSTAGSQGTDYSFTGPTIAAATASISAKALTSTASIGGTLSKTYDGTTAATAATLSGSVSGAIAGDTLSLDSSGMTFSYDSAHVATASQISASGSADFAIDSSTAGSQSTDYSFTGPTIAPVAASITPATLTPTLTNSGVTKVYDGTTDAPAGFTPTWSFSGLASGDTAATLTATGSAYDSSHVATAGTVTVSGLSIDSITGSNSAASTDYTLDATGKNVAATITAKPVTVSALTADNKVYDGTDGVVISDWGSVATGVVGETLSLSATDAAFADVNAGNGITVTANGYTLGDGTNGLASDYQLTGTSASTTADISKAPLTVTANDDAKILTQADLAGYNGVSYDGLVGGETPAVISAGTITRTGMGAGNGVNDPAGNYSGVLVAGGYASNNYAITYVNGNYIIVPADQLLVKVTNSAAVYGTTPTFGISSAAYLNGSNVLTTLTQSSANGNTSTWTDGAGGTVTFTLVPDGATTSGSGNYVVGNYAVTGSNTSIVGSNFTALNFVGNLAVTQHALAPSASNVGKVYDSTTAMTGATLGLSGLIANDVVTAGGTGAFDTYHAGSGLGYTVNNIVLAGADAGNYYLSGTTLSGSDGEITPAPLTVSGITAADKVYDGSTSASVDSSAAVYGGLFGGDEVTVAATGAFGDKNVGIDKTVTLSSSYAGANAGDYSITNQTSTTATITPAPLTVTGTIVADKVYDGMTDAALSDGVLAGTIYAGDDVTLATQAGSFATPNVGTGIAVTAADVLGGTSADNYLLIQPVGLAADITPAQTPVSLLKAQAVSAQLLASLSLPAFAQAQATGLSPTITVNRFANTEARNDGAPSSTEADVSGGMEIDIKMTSGKLGPILQIRNGGMRLPEDIASARTELMQGMTDGTTDGAQP